MPYSPADLILHKKARYGGKKSLRHLCILKPTDKISGTFLITITGHRARNIAKQAKY